jgi:hypothetical protein
VCNRPSHRGASSQYRGVYFDKNRKFRPWRAAVRVNGEKVTLGSFADEREAGKVVYDFLSSIGWPVDPLETAEGHATLALLQGAVRHQDEK